jgi:hypothetical protein
MDVNQALETYEKETVTPLCTLFDTFGTDKGSHYHYYSRFYQSLFNPIQQESFSLFEMGIGTNDTQIGCNMGENGKPGASLRAWETYFPKAKLYAADIDPKIQFETPRIKTFCCDQTNPESIHAMWNSPELKERLFRVIIDDGLHEPNACRVFFENSIHKLEKGGVYIVEDIGVGNLVLPYLELVKYWALQYPDCRFWFFYVTPVVEKTKENWMIVCQRV